MPGTESQATGIHPEALEGYKQELGVEIAKLVLSHENVTPDVFNGLVRDVVKTAANVVDGALQSPQSPPPPQQQQEFEPVYVTVEKRPDSETEKTSEIPSNYFECTLSPGETAAFRFNPSEINELLIMGHHDKRTVRAPGVFATINPQLPQLPNLIGFIDADHPSFEPLEAPVFFMSMANMRARDERQIVEQNAAEAFPKYYPGLDVESNPEALAHMQFTLDKHYPFKGLLTDNPTDPTKGELTPTVLWSNDDQIDYSILHLRKTTEEGQPESSSGYRITADHDIEVGKRGVVPVAHTVINGDIMLVGVPKAVSHAPLLGHIDSPFPKIRVESAIERLDLKSLAPRDLERITSLMDKLNTGELIKQFQEEKPADEPAHRRSSQRVREREDKTNDRTSASSHSGEKAKRSGHDESRDPSSKSSREPSSQPSSHDLPQHVANLGNLSSRHQRRAVRRGR